MTKELIAKPIIKEIYSNLSSKIENSSIKPKLALFSVGDDPSSAFYIRNIIKRADKLGIIVDHRSYPDSLTTAEFIKKVVSAGENRDIHAVMIQKPLPKQIDENIITSHINPEKDVDGFTAINLGKLLLEQDALLPCTPAAVMHLIDYYGIELTGKNTVLCGRSLIVGKPLLNMLIGKGKPGNATVTVCHSRTKNLSDYTIQADILITALGIPRFIKKEHVKEGVIIIDVGTNEISENDKTIYVGDVDYEGCYEKAAAITPVPGGIGSITTAMLMQNIVKTALR